MNAMSDAGSDVVTVTCQASLPELRAATFWLYTHDRKSQIRILFYLALIIAIFVLLDFAANSATHHWTAFYQQQWNYLQLRRLASFVWLVGGVYYGVSQLVTLPARAWRRTQAAGPTTLTVSSNGLSWHNSEQRKEVGWDQYNGYVVLPEVLIFVSKVPYIVPRSTVRPVDFERVLTITKRHLQPVKWFDSGTGRISPESSVR